MIELLLLAPEEAVETVTDALIDELGALSASVEDADADTDAEHALFGEPGMPAPAGGWKRSRIVALFENDEAATEASTLLLAQDWAKDVALVAMRPVAEQDWVRLTQSQFQPVDETDKDLLSGGVWDLAFDGNGVPIQSLWLDRSGRTPVHQIGGDLHLVFRIKTIEIGRAHV